MKVAQEGQLSASRLPSGHPGICVGAPAEREETVRIYTFKLLLLGTYHQLRGTGTVTGRLAEDPYDWYQQGMLWPS